MNNDTSVILTGALNASQSIHTAICHVRNDHIETQLLKALHNTFIIAEQCRQIAEREIKQRADESERNA